MKKGIFITFEGTEGCGKSTQALLLADYLRGLGWEVLLTREPGGTGLGERLRGVLLGSPEALAPVTELLLFAADRAQHVEEVIRPALEAGKAVVCDRYSDSTFAYQHFGRGLPLEAVEAVCRVATGGVVPDLTFVLDVPVEEGLARARGRGLFDRFEDAELAFHERVREGYLELARREPGRVRVVASGTVDEVAEDVRRALSEFLARAS